MGTTTSGQWCLDLVAEERRGLLQQLRQVTAHAAGFQVPAKMAGLLGLKLEYLVAVPGGLPYLTDGRTVWVRHHPDQRVRGTTAFVAISSAVLALQRVERTRDAVVALAGRLAAPPALVMDLGLDETIRRQPWATERFLVWWWSSLRHSDTDAPT
ncbi:hypothetical protein [Sorangium sp. So ce233]|uniref:hypothetical protein n=1 Tax=Sorangium sp. So ce233 TaxID=3133290 RepID=UPI003F6250F6